MCFLQAGANILIVVHGYFGTKMTSMFRILFFESVEPVCQRIAGNTADFSNFINCHVLFSVYFSDFFCCFHILFPFFVCIICKFCTHLTCHFPTKTKKDGFAVLLIFFIRQMEQKRNHSDNCSVCQNDNGSLN